MFGWKAPMFDWKVPLFGCKAHVKPPVFEEKVPVFDRVQSWVESAKTGMLRAGQGGLAGAAPGL